MEPFEVSEDLIRFIESEIERLDAEAKRIEADLYREIDRALSSSLSIESGVLQDTSGNYRAVSLVDRAFKSLRAQLSALYKSFVDGLLLIVMRVQEYFEAAGFPSAKVRQIAEQNRAIEAILGIVDGKLLPGGYLDKLAQGEELKSAVKNYVLKSISSKAAYSDFAAGLRSIVLTSPDGNGLLVRYLNQYAYDTYNQVRELKNRQFAEGLNLRYFIYQGSIIKDSRAFCRKRVGKAFAVEETKTWKSDPDLIDKKTAASYNPLLERGRYNCRHWIDYISEETYNRIKGQQNG